MTRRLKYLVGVIAASAIALAIVLLASHAAHVASDAARDPPGKSGTSAPPGLDALRVELETIARREDGVVGVAVTHIETGEHLSVNGDVSFPMHSVDKLPIAITVLEKVDAGQLALDGETYIGAADVAPSMADADRWAKVPTKRTMRQLLDLSIIESDNTATDKLLSSIGGPQAVVTEMRDLHVAGVNVSRSTKQIVADFCLGDTTPAKTAADIVAACHNLSDDAKLVARKREEKRGADVATPNAIVDLLVALYRSSIVDAASRDFLLGAMYESRVGPHRLKGALPEGTRVAHKTGTGYFATNDVGIIDLPDGKGHVAVAVFIKLSKRDEAAQDATIAALARAVYDHYTR